MKILVTRPAGDAEKTAKELRARGHEAIVAPLMEIRFRDGAEIPLGEIQAILVTSANGARALARRTVRRDLPILAVGPQTAERALALGFQNVRSAGGDAEALARAVTGWIHPEGGALLHVHGAQTKGDLAARLSAAGFHVRSEILYEAVAAKALPPAAAAALGSGSLDAVLLYSQRSARIFARCAVQAGLGEACRPLVALCIGEAAAEALAPLPFRAIHIAAHPDRAGLFALLR